MIELEFVVWEFVRLMVELEESDGVGKGEGALATWQAPWQEIDDRLTELSKSDPDGFAQLMMDQTISVSCAARSHLSEAIDAVGRVTRKLEAEITKIHGDAERKDELKFELAELTELVDQLRAIDPAMLSGS